MDNTASRTISPDQNELLTRVSRACDRCRRHKSKCDLFRPCTLCQRAKVPCRFTRGSAHRVQKQRDTRLDVQPSTHIDDVRHQTPMEGTRGKSQGNASHVTSHHVAIPPAVDPFATPSSMHSISTDSSELYQKADSTMSIARKLFLLGERSLPGQSISALPDGDTQSDASAGGSSTRDVRSVSDVLGCALPSLELTLVLLEEYFDSVHWFSLVICEPKFRAQLETIAAGDGLQSQKSFLLLLATMLGLAAWYRSKRLVSEVTMNAVDWGAWASSLLRHVETHLFDVMTDSSMESLQVCILLGSYHSYHGKPKASFAMLGASVKMAQAMGLHRESAGENEEIMEESRRVWWTIYTWDRWASITYGRPFTIDDAEHSVPMPGDVYESRQFLAADIGRNEMICYSAYQRELNRLYVIASPLIKSIFGADSERTCRPSAVGYSEFVGNVTRQMSHWQSQLPTHLAFESRQDIEANASMKMKVFRLQSLALQLTFDHLIIIFHRPILTQQVSSLVGGPERHKSSLEHLLNHSNTPQPSLYKNSSESYIRPPLSISEHWWNAALRTSQLIQLPQLTHLATDGHLLAFLAINLFNSAVVMVVYAFCNPLSDRAQEGKRNVTCIYRLQELLGNRGMLPLQSCLILRDLIHMIAQRETSAMLAPVRAPEQDAYFSSSTHDLHSQDLGFDVEDELYPGFTPPRSTSLNIHHSNNILPLDGVLPVNEGTERLNEGLLSVQQVFLGPSGLSSKDQPGQHDPANESSTGGRAQSGNFSPRFSGTNHSQGGIDSSMYWLWDSCATNFGPQS